ncbi:hypothetical protein FVR03_21735 [Pontibacter qinzhouensis]|uniref:Uncharacterized protein n=1 Tax=Pontibacter qinzhouensis TaxID=2603253 RepID=A0A5C8IZ75_9BACT|nr:hypothetical protein [Pontibacter qinzhouensis]TXK26547.1 hypothetical protein FVR03_21735 [Pontibacter qinzhouensis]
MEDKDSNTELSKTPQKKEVKYVAVFSEEEAIAQGDALVKKETPARTDGPIEADYLDNKEFYLPFSTSLRADHYLLLKRIEYYDRLSIRELFEDILEQGLKNYPSRNKELPEKVVKKLKQLKSANMYYHERVQNKTGEGPKKKKES